MSERAALLARTKELADLVKKAEAAQNEISGAFEAMLKQVGNLVADGVPPGGEDDYVVLETLGTPRDFAAEGFVPRDHLELGQLLGAIDVERGAKVSGSRFYYLTGQGAELELALINLAMSLALKNGFIPMIPPALVKPQAMEGTGFLGQAAQDVYHLEEDDLYLVGTAEVPLAAYHSDEILDRGAAAAAVRRLQPELSPRGRLVRQGHPGHLPRALVRQGGDVRLLRAGGGRRRAPAAAGSGRRSSSPRWRSPSRCSSWPAVILV